MEFYINKDVKTRKFNHHWKFCVGSGHASLALRKDYVEHLSFVSEQLGIKRVRFHGVMDDDMHTFHRMSDFSSLKGAEKFTEQSFRYIGLVYDNILSCNMKPFVEIGFMPKHLAKDNAVSSFFYHSNISMPKNDEIWSDYIKDFINYLIDRYGEEEVESWHFEVWNEPDLGDPFFAGDMLDYFYLYKITAQAIKSINHKLRVGGPSTSGSKWISEFLEYCKKNNVPLDFVSTHQYAGDPLGGVVDETQKIPYDRSQKERALQEVSGGTVLEGYRVAMPDQSETEDLVDYVFRKNAQRVKKQVGQYPLFYTEWNESAVFSAYTNDTTKVAAYIIKAILDVENYVDGSSVWCFSDIFEEFHPFAEEFHGGFGLLTQHGIPKPSYHALKFLSLVGDRRMELDDEHHMRGEVSIAGFDTGDGKMFILTRQKMKNLNLSPQSVTLKVDLTHKPKAVTVMAIDEFSGNPIKIWEENGSKIDLTPSEVKRIKDKSAIVEKDLYYTYNNGVLETNISLLVNDVYLIKVVE